WLRQYKIIQNQHRTIK
ncbi:unnamed protein product, partial [Rotaria sordida]